MIRANTPAGKDRPALALRAQLAGIRQALSPGPHAWRGAAWGLLLATAFIWLSFWLSLVNSSFGFVVTLIVAGGLLGMTVLLGNLNVALLELFNKLPLLYRWMLISAVVLLALLFTRVLAQPLNTVGAIAFVVVVASLLGASLAVLLSNFKALAWPKKALTLAGLLLGLGGAVAAGAWLFWPGPAYALPSSGWASSSVPPLALENPASPGSYGVLTLSYGSGNDLRRSEYAAGASIVTDSVDISGLVGGWGGPVGWLRTRYWGFDLARAPLNAQVWYPSGEGPFPLVLIVHGNHAMDDPSEGGYAYLGELLASRGFILASVDQNFLNFGGIVEGIFGGLQEDNDARAYLLLEHLRLWHGWNRQADSPFYNRVDTDNIALIGHSRGGEAAAIAAAFNGLPAHPDNALVRFGHDYTIRTVIAIAPSDGQYRPRGQGTPLENINYLVLQGAADGDVRSFQGASQYDRVRFTDAGFFKAAVYVHGANHGQFNTHWGRVDTAPAWALNLGDIMPADEQLRAGKVFLSAFLEATLKGQRDYLALFRSPQSARGWLPGTLYLSQFADSSTQYILTFEEDLDATTTTLPGGRVQGEHLSEWREGVVRLGWNPRETVAAHLAWNRDENPRTARYTVTLPRGTQLAGSALVFALADGRGADQTDGLDFSLELMDASGQRARLPLSEVMPLPPQLSYRAFKPPLGVRMVSEPVFTGYDVPLAAFTELNPAFDGTAIRELSFVFDRSPAGRIILSELGWR